MKIKDGFLLREVAGSYVVVPIGQRVVEFNGLLTLSESGALLWRRMENDTTITELVNSICREYEIDKEIAKLDTLSFINGMKENGFLIDD